MRRFLSAAGFTLAIVPACAVATVMLTGAAPHAPQPAPGGLIGTLQQGRYACELPGDASGPIHVSASQFDFTVIRGSSYRAGKSRGSYLLTGDMVTMTGGRLKGLKLHLVSEGFLRRVEADGSDGDMRCILGTAGNSSARSEPHAASPDASGADSVAPSATPASPSPAASVSPPTE